MKNMKFSTGGDPALEALSEAVPVTLAGKRVGSAVKIGEGILSVIMDNGIDVKYLDHEGLLLGAIDTPEPITRGELREVIFSAHGMGHVSVDASINPDCRSGKHKPVCAGDGWDVEKDEPTTCHCDCHN